MFIVRYIGNNFIIIFYKIIEIKKTNMGKILNNFIKYSKSWLK